MEASGITDRDNQWKIRTRFNLIITISVYVRMYQGSSYHVVRTQLGKILPFPIFDPPIHVGLQRRLLQHDAHVRISGVNIHFPVDLRLVVGQFTDS